MKGDSSPRDRCPNQCSLLQRTRHRFLRGTHDRRRFMARLCRMADRSFPAGFLWVSILILDLFPDGKSMEIHYVENLGNQEVFFFFLGGVLKQIPEFVYLIPSESISWSADAASLKQFLEHLAQSRRWPSWIEDPKLALNPAHSASDNWVYPETGYVYIIIYYDILIIY